MVDSNFLPLVDGEIQLTDGSELVWRQCAPGHFDRRTGLPTDTMFRATTADNGKISGNRKTKASAKGSFEHRTQVLKKDSEGTFGVTVDEIESVGSRAVDDSALQPSPPPPPSPGHTYIDVRHLDGLTKSERQVFRSTLLINAVKRKRQHP